MARRKPKRIERIDSPWPRRMAWGLTWATFLSILIGGLVTSYNAWAAVPIRADTGQYNLFSFYPPGSWLAVWDVLLEHSHRLLGAAAAIIAVGLTVVLWRCDRRKSVRWLGVVAVAAIVAEGTLGGLRVLGDQVLLAQAHACIGPLSLALCAALVIVTSRPWLDGSEQQKGPRTAAPLPSLALANSLGIFLQIVLGAQLRHVLLEAAPGWSLFWVWLHVIVAGLAAVGLVWLLILVLRRMRNEPMIVRRAWLLGGLFVLQLVLGATAWVTSYGWPNWFKDYVWALEYTVVAEGPLQVIATTAHMAVGSLNLAVALSLTMWTFRPPGRVEHDWLASMWRFRQPARSRAVAIVPLAILGRLFTFSSGSFTSPNRRLANDDR